MRLLRIVPLTLGMLTLAVQFPARVVAADLPRAVLTLQTHQFEPAELTVPAGQKIELHIVNKDPSSAEFESTDLHREKVVSGGGEVTVFIGPLQPGAYEFFDDFNPKTAHGRLIAK